MPIDLYCNKMSGPCRLVLLAAKQLDVELNIKELNLPKGEHLKPEFVKINPQHSIPTLVDGDLMLAESRAIITYLADKYSKNTTLYPKDLKARAMVDQRNQFDQGLLAVKFADYAYPVVFGGASPDATKLKPLEDALGHLEIFLERSQFVAGPHLTLADISIAVTVSTIEAVGVDVNKYPKIKAWFETLKKLPGYEEINAPGAGMFKQLFIANSKK